MVRALGSFTDLRADQPELTKQRTSYATRATEEQHEPADQRPVRPVHRPSEQGHSPGHDRAWRGGWDRVDTEHLLLAIADAGDGTAAMALAALWISLDDI